jgi:sulfatase maturation enzyme AslB (radical SAM superfamily)
MIDRLKPADLTVAHSFQTNGTLIDEAWCAFFAEERVNVGVSVDGPKHLHDRNRLTRSGRGTFDKTIAGIRLLRRNGVPFHCDLGPVDGQHGGGPRDVRFLCCGGDRGDLLQCRGI